MDYKDIARKITPPIILEIRAYLIDRARRKKITIGKQPFLEWWESQKSSEAMPVPLVEMIEHFINTSDSQLMSNYWWFLAKRNINQIANSGWDNFKQTIARNYYTWVGDDANILMRKVDIAAVSEAAGSQGIPVGEIFKKHDYFTIKESLAFNLNTILMYCALGFPQIIDEPLDGNPPGISINGKLITQDLLNSFLDYESISKVCRFDEVKCVLELGAGYGRTAHYVLTMHPSLSYIIVDIPPALYVSQRYLTGLFPHKKTIHFDPALTQQSLRYAIANGAIIFMTPDQLKLLEQKSVDLWVAIDCLHAMTMQQVAAYLGQIDRVAKMFYFTYWPGMPMPYDDYTHDVEKWPVPSSWEILNKEPTYIPSCYVNVAYKI